MLSKGLIELVVVLDFPPIALEFAEGKWLIEVHLNSSITAFESEPHPEQVNNSARPTVCFRLDVIGDSNRDKQHIVHSLLLDALHGMLEHSRVVEDEVGLAVVRVVLKEGDQILVVGEQLLNGGLLNGPAQMKRPVLAIEKVELPIAPAPDFALGLWSLSVECGEVETVFRHGQDLRQDLSVHRRTIHWQEDERMPLERARLQHFKLTGMVEDSFGKHSVENPSSEPICQPRHPRFRFLLIFSTAGILLSNQLTSFVAALFV